MGRVLPSVAGECSLPLTEKVHLVTRKRLRRFRMRRRIVSPAGSVKRFCRYAAEVATGDPRRFRSAIAVAVRQNRRAF